MSDTGSGAVDYLSELLVTSVQKEGLQTARGGRAGPVLYPASLEYAQGLGSADNDILTTKERYYLHESKRLIVGKYVPDPKTLVRPLDQPTIDDIIKAGSTATPATTATATAGGGEQDDVPSQAKQQPTTTKRQVLSSTNDDSDDKNWEDVANSPTSKVEQEALDLVTRRIAAAKEKKPKTISRYRLVQPLFPAPLSSGTLFFPIYYPNKPTAKERNDPRGVAKEINSEMHGEYTQPSGGMVVSQVDNLNKMGLYKVGPGAVAFKCVINSFEVAGLKYTTGNDWNVMWAKRATPELLANMGPYQRINHFIGAWGIGRKDNLHKNVQIMKKQFGKAFDIVPASFVIPTERKELEKDMEMWQKSVNQPGFIPTYICKPVASSCGKGIHLVQGLPPNPKAANKTLLVQRYIGNPMLIEGRKFDLRIYVAVTSFDPLRVSIFDEGLVRFAAEKYPGPDCDLANTHMHLTNYSVNKTAALAKESVGKEIEDDDGPVEIKWLLSEFKEHIISKSGCKTKAEGEARWKHIETQMHDIIIKSMLVVEMDVITQMRAHSRDGTGRESFELYGFDLIVDENFRLDLLEVNIMPSLATGFSIDKAVKQRLLAHLLTMVGVIPYDRRRTRLEDGGLTPEEEMAEDSRKELRDQLLSSASGSSGGGRKGGQIFSAASGGKSDLRYHYTLPKGHGGRASSKNHSAISAEFIDEPLLKSLENKKTSSKKSAQRPEVSAAEIAMLIESDEELHRSGGWNRIFPIPYNGESSKRDYFHLFRCGVLRKNYLLASWEEMKGKLLAQGSAANGTSDGSFEDVNEEDDTPGPVDG